MAKIRLSAIAVEFTDSGFKTDSERIMRPLMRHEFEAKNTDAVVREVQVMIDALRQDAVILGRVIEGRAPKGFKRLKIAGGSGQPVKVAA